MPKVRSSEKIRKDILTRFSKLFPDDDICDSVFSKFILDKYVMICEKYDILRSLEED